MIDDTKIKQYPREASPKQMADLLEKLERDREMNGSDGRYDKPKKEKRVVKPIEIPEVLSAPHRQPIIKTELTELPESNTRRPVGLSQRFTQDKIREAQILKQLDKEMADDERMNSNATNIGGDHD